MNRTLHLGGITATIIKAMSIFGGVQVVNIVCSFLRNKIIAMLIGPAGVGITSIYNSAADLISALTTLGLRNSAARDLAAEPRGASRTQLIAIVRRWAWILALFGAAITLAFSPLLSYISFGDYSHSWCFAAISIAIFANSITLGELAVLQGTSQLSAIARGTISGAVLGLASVFPLIYFYRQDGIVPMIVAYYIFAAIATWWVGRRKEQKEQCEVTSEETIRRGKALFKLGIMLTLSMSVTYLFNYIFNILLKDISSESTVGLYNAGNMLVRRYAELIFSAMAVEYFPRLSGASHSNSRLAVFVNQQMRITLIVLIPVIAIFITCRRFIITLLYSSDFLAVEHFIAIAAIGTVFRAVSWCMSFVILAKGDGKTFLITEVVSDAVGFGLYVLGFTHWGITGIGIAYTIWYALYTLLIGYVYLRKYRLHLAPATVAIAATALLFACGIYALSAAEIPQLHLFSH